LNLEAQPSPKDAMKHWKSVLGKKIELQYGLLDDLVSKGVCDLEQVKAIEDTEFSRLYREKIVKKLAEILNSDNAHREQILKLLKMNNQHHVAEFIEHEGRKYRSVTGILCFFVYESY
jgi:hypothetical protein